MTGDERAAALDLVERFVAGALEASAFAAELQKNADLEAVLDDGVAVRRGERLLAVSAFYYVIEHDLSVVESEMDVREVLTEFLQRHGRQVEPAVELAELQQIALDASPSWIDPDLSIVKELLAPEQDGPDTGESSVERLRRRLQEVYKCAGRPPRWVQGPRWPIVNGVPLVFLGQIKVEDYFHDDAEIYLFHDPATGEVQSVLQIS